MKRFSFVLLTMLAMSVCISSCSKDDDDSGGSDALVGKWLLIEDSDGMQSCSYDSWYEFKSDGTYTYYDGCMRKIDDAGSWKKEGDKLTVTSNEFPVAMTLTISISSNEFTVTANMFGDVLFTQKFKRA